MDINQCLQDPQRVSIEDNSKLLVEFIEKEIKEALFTMNPLGALEPDGFLARFYQKHWSILGQNVCSYVLNMLNQTCSLDSVNATFITLIPKVKEAKKIGDFRPTSLCNVI